MSQPSAPRAQPTSAASPARSRALRAVLMTLSASCLFVINDALAKYVSQSMPSAQLIFMRSLMVVALLLLLAWHQGALAQLPKVTQPRVLLRSAADATGTAMYLLSLFQLPLANAIAINLAAPLFMTLFAVLFLRERASPVRWIAVVIGFLGVLLVVRPTGEGFNVWALLCLLGTLLHAWRDLLTRQLDPKLPSVVLTLSSAVALGLLAALGLPVQGWQPISLLTVALITVGAACLAGAFLCLIESLRLAEISLLAPFRYSGLLFAVLLGFLVWQDVPDFLGFTGIGLLIGAGLLVVHSEQASRSRPQ